MTCASCNHAVHTSACTVAGCGCGVCVWPGLMAGCRGIVEDLATQVNRVMPMHEDIRSLRHAIDLASTRLEALRSDIRALSVEVAAVTESVAALRRELQQHTNDERVHSWLAADNGGG